MMLAITHVPSPAMDDGQRTFVSRSTIDNTRAVRQHVDYCALLRRCGADVRTLDVNRDLPDCAFVEATAAVHDEAAVLTSMGTQTRRPELAGIELELRKHRQVRRVEPPARLEGGDVLRVGRSLLVGLSSRTDAAGVRALQTLARPFEYAVVPVPVQSCLHLKTACTALPDRSLLINPAWIDLQALGGFEIVPVPEAEPWAANVLSIGNQVCVAAAHERTADLIRSRGFAVEMIDLCEFAKAEGGVTCLSILVDDARGTAPGCRQP
jgi:dimethylargininase